MGLLAEVSGQPQQFEASEEVLLLHGVMLMMEAGGVIEDSERQTLTSYLYSLPEFADKDGGEIDTMIAQRQKLCAPLSSYEEAIQLLAGIETPVLRKKVFALAVEVALASGDVAENEDKVLDGMQRILEIDDELAKNIVEVFSLKFSR